jgi:NADP-dependent 3-hydroxy acid dehydrogenase YdfG
MGRVENKVAIVTGAASGIGATIDVQGGAGVLIF